MNKKNIIWGIVGVVVLIAVFYGGVAYGKSQVPARGAGFTFAGGAGGRTGRTGATGGFTTGQIIAKDATSITVQLMSGGSKIIFVDGNTKISKSVNGTISDLVIGTDVSITGASNTDGSINATSVQIRPNIPQGAKVQ